MKLPLLLVLVAAPAVALADPPGTCDLSTDAGIDAAYKAATGKTISTYGGRCVQRSTTFPSLIAIGAFRTDVGCHWLGLLHDCAWNDKRADVSAMATAGWAKADAKRRGELAIAWLTEIEQIRTEDAHAAVVGGKLVVDFWTTPPAGMRDEPRPRTHSQVTFRADGTHEAITAAP